MTEEFAGHRQLGQEGRRTVCRGLLHVAHLRLETALFLLTVEPTLWREADADTDKPVAAANV